MIIFLRGNTNFEKYFIIEGAKKVLIKIDDLKDAEGNPKKSNAMHEMSFVVWDKFLLAKNNF